MYVSFDYSGHFNVGTYIFFYSSIIHMCIIETLTTCYNNCLTNPFSMFFFQLVIMTVRLNVGISLNITTRLLL